MSILEAAIRTLQANTPSTWATRHGIETIDVLTAPTLVSWVSTISRDPGGGTLTLEVETWLLLPDSTAPLGREDKLEEALTTWIGVLESTRDVTWETTTRGVLSDKFDGYRTVLTCYARLESE